MRKGFSCRFPRQLPPPNTVQVGRDGNKSRSQPGKVGKGKFRFSWSVPLRRRSVLVCAFLVEWGNMLFCFIFALTASTNENTELIGKQLLLSYNEICNRSKMARKETELKSHQAKKPQVNN